MHSQMLSDRARLLDHCPSANVLVDLIAIRNGIHLPRPHGMKVKTKILHRHYVSRLSQTKSERL